MSDHPMHDAAINRALGPLKLDNTRRGFRGLRCLNCGEEDHVWVYISDVASFQCSNCDGQFGPVDVAKQIELWGPVLAWVAQAPTLLGRGG